MQIEFVVAVDENDAIGAQGRIPWRVRADLRRFKHLTMGHHILMGRRTWESLPGPLPGRVNLIVTRQTDYAAAGAIVCPSPQAGVELARQAGESTLFVIGGAQVYNALLPLAERIYLSRIHTRNLQADTFFHTDFLRSSAWRCVQREQVPPQAGDTCGHTFEVWERAAPLPDDATPKQAA